ncbi:SLC13 family permease [Oryzobacter sp. R7]|uniref:SLC13 family permease n=1 Tax=Oryzobacter faecalis TaxID=3388656 RepID=UPI00398CB193
MTLLDAAALEALVLRLLPVVVFLLAITVTAEVAERAGVFDVAGHRVAHWGRHRAWALWVLFAALAVGCTVVLSIDTTAVLLTPVGLAVARQVGLDARLFAVTTLWVANTGSLLLPVSNLTNLLALHTVGRLGLGHGDFVRLAWAPALACVGATLLLVAALHRRTLAAGYAVDPPPDPHDAVLLRWAGAVCVALGPLFALGAPPWAVSVVSAAVLLAVARRRAPALLADLPVPWLMAGAFVGVSLAVEVLHEVGLTQVVTGLLPAGSGAAALAGVAGAGAVVSNAVNNLPAYLLLEPAVAEAPERLMALLVGVNAGPLVTPWASLATLLWLQRCRGAGVVVPWRWLLPAGAACAALSVGAGALALAATS